jgi:tetratricopeptide (TPR) repeat protein
MGGWIMNDRVGAGPHPEYSENALEASARALSEFVVRAAVLPITLLLAKPSHLARGHETASGYKPLPTPFLLALVTGLLVSGVTGSLATSLNSGVMGGENGASFFRSVFDFYREMDGAQAILFAVPFMAFVWLAAGIVSFVMARGLKNAEPLFATFSYCLAAIAEVAAIGIAVSFLWPHSASSALAPGLLLGFVAYAAILAIKLVRVVLVLRKSQSSPLVMSLIASVPAAALVLLVGVGGGGTVAAVAAMSGASIALADEAETFLEQGDFEQAVNTYDEAIRLNPQDANAYYQRALARRGDGDADGAMADLNEAVRLDPNFEEAFYARGRIYFDRKNYEGAITDYSEAIRIDPSNAIFLNSRCWVRAVAGVGLELALADCDESLRLRPGNANTLDSRGLVHLRLSLYPQALEDYNAAVTINPDMAGALYGRGLAHLWLGESEQGGRDIIAALLRDEQVESVFREYGVALPANTPQAPVAEGAPATARLPE